MCEDTYPHRLARRRAVFLWTAEEAESGSASSLSDWTFLSTVAPRWLPSATGSSVLSFSTWLALACGRTKCVTQGSGRLDGFVGTSVIVGLVIELVDWCDRRQRPLLGGGFVRRSPLTPISAHLRSFGTRPCGSIVQQVVGFAAHGLSLSGPLPRCGRVARGEWGNLAVRGCLIKWENAYWVDSRQMRQMRVLISWYPPDLG